MKNKKIKWAIGLLIIMWMSISGQYVSIPELYDKAWLLGLRDVSMLTAVAMFIPLICSLVNRGSLQTKKGKRICIWNSIGMFCLSASLTAVLETDGFIGIGGVGAVMYYFINKWLFVSDVNTAKPTIKEKKQEELEISNEEKEEPTELKSQKQKYCKLCGGKLDDNNKCRRCGKQYFKIKNHLMFIVTFCLLIISVVFNILQYFDKKDVAELYTNSHYEKLQYREKAEFLDENIVFVLEGYGDYYYTYDCVQKITDGEYSYWAYNKEAAVGEGYRKGTC